jgi:wyosine [tRNA(Phe)-imidazoG37] synthetase (radical SAM superfamily)
MNTPPKSKATRYVFGPVPSRRLGRSLGVDLVPFKTCSYDCIYCQLGRTTCRTIERREWVRTATVLKQLREKLSTRPDYITLSGSGEPTLHSGLGKIIQQIKAMTSIPIAVLTNGSLLWQKEVREEISLADLVLPSLDAPDAERFEFINRPHPEITYSRMLQGLQELRQEFAGKYWLEVMLLAGYNALPPEIRELVSQVRRIKPDKVQLNTAVRPPAEDYAIAVQPERLKEIARAFKPAAECIAEYRAAEQTPSFAGSADLILEMLQRRPCTEDDIAAGLLMPRLQVAKHLAVLEAEGRVHSRRRDGLIFYTLGSTDAPGRGPDTSVTDQSRVWGTHGIKEGV